MIAVAEMQAGLIDADLGGGLVKKRVAWPGRGKRGGGRLLVATHFESCWFFLFGFAKNERADVSPAELDALRKWAGDLLGLEEAQLASALAAGEIEEIKDAYPARKN